MYEKKKLIIPFKVQEDSVESELTLVDFSFPWREEECPETIFKAYHDREYLYFQFHAFGSEPLIHRVNDNKLEVIHSERVEIFFRINESMKPYYCLEIDPIGRTLDYKAEYYRKFNREWQWPDDLEIETEITDSHYVVKGCLNLKTLEQMGLLKQSILEVGLYRGYCSELIEGKAKLKWISWVDSQTTEPDFHVPSSFGTFELADF